MAANALDALRERGFVQQVTDEAAVRAMFAAGPVVAYVGLDPTADSLHAGSLVPLMALIHLERLGHRPIVVLGGGTARIGDPSGKTELRELLPGERIDGNVTAIAKQVGRWLDFAGRSRCVNNADWLLDLKYVDFLRNIGRHFSVNRMLAAEAYKQRLERGLSFIEFNYQILQAYDFLELYRRNRCVLQMGGDDQWGNILAGVDLIRRLEGVTVQAITFPLLTTATGDKMGKTASGALWLEASRCRPYDFYQYWVNVHDADVGKLLALFTFLPMPEVKAAGGLSGAALNAAKSILAYEVTTLVHGEDEAKRAHAAAQAAFGGRALPAGILPSSTAPRSTTAAVEEIPTTLLSSGDVSRGVSLAELLVNTGLARSKNEARRLIRQQAIYLNDAAARDENHMVTAADFKKRQLLVRAGKKRVHRVLVSS
ncbi:MAG: tyrosine--tRNA ligase [Deltaproteobacteria bacterium]|nr:tyrosine--tRNA ligase [Deltaproteobacteria bacterium]